MSDSRNEDVIDLMEDNVLVIVDEIVKEFDSNLKDVSILDDTVLAVKYPDIELNTRRTLSVAVYNANESDNVLYKLAILD